MELNGLPVVPKCEKIPEGRTSVCIHGISIFIDCIFKTKLPDSIRFEKKSVMQNCRIRYFDGSFYVPHVLRAKHTLFFLGGAARLSHPKAPWTASPSSSGREAPLAFRVSAHGRDWMAPHKVRGVPNMDGLRKISLKFGWTMEDL